MPYDRQYAHFLLDWAKTEIVGVSPLALRCEELAILLLNKLESGKVDFAHDIMKELREGLEELERQRCNISSLKASGAKVKRHPDYIIVNQLFTTNPSIPDGQREWAISHIVKGETYV